VVPTPHGPIVVAWRRQGGRIRGSATIPSGVRATLSLPGSKPRRLASGRTTWAVELASR
jgi:hypothetical protein